MDILYSFRRCPYAIRARWALIECNRKVFIREVDLKDKPKELTLASKKGTVPILICSNGDVIEESIEIMLLALSYAEAKRRILGDDYTSKNISYIINENDTKFKFYLDRYKYPNRFKQFDRVKNLEEIMIILSKWNDQVEESSTKSGKGWLCGERETIADWAIWPFVRQFKLVNTEFFCQNKRLFSLNKWLDHYINHTNYQIVMQKNQFWGTNKKDIIYPAE